jgi:hypothetical protein
MNIILPQPVAFAILIIPILVITALLGDRFAVQIKERPFKKTWQEVVVGVGGSEFAIFLLSEGTFWILGILSTAWWIPIVYPVLIYATTGGCQIIRQEQKIKQDKQGSAEIKSLDDVVKWRDVS